MKLLPRSLLWRTFLFVALLMLLSVVAWFAIFSTYEREPRARQLAQAVVSIANLTRAALISARPEARRELLRDLSDREGIRIYPADATDRVEPLPDRTLLHRVEELVKQQLGPADSRQHGAGRRAGLVRQLPHRRRRRRHLLAGAAPASASSGCFRWAG